MAKMKFARFVARGETDVLIGKNFRGLFEPGVIYQAEEILGEIVIRKVGDSSATKVKRGGGTMPAIDCRSIEDLAEDGTYLLTTDELDVKKRTNGTAA